MKQAEIIAEWGPFDEIEGVHGVTWDGRRVWFASGDRIHAVDPDSGRIEGSIAVPADAGTAFDGRYLYQIAEKRIRKIDPATGAEVHSIPAPGEGCDSGLAWSEGSLWVGQYQNRAIIQVDPETGRVLRSIQSDRFVTGVTWTQEGLWHGTWEGDESELRRVDVDGTVRERYAFPAGTNVSGLEASGDGRFFCGGGRSRKLRVVRRPKR